MFVVYGAVFGDHIGAKQLAFLFFNFFLRVYFNIFCVKIFPFWFMQKFGNRPIGREANEDFLFFCWNYRLNLH